MGRMCQSVVWVGKGVWDSGINRGYTKVWHGLGRVQHRSGSRCRMCVNGQCSMNEEKDVQVGETYPSDL